MHGAGASPYCARLARDETRRRAPTTPCYTCALTFDDTDGEERVELILHNEEIRIIWDSANRTVGVYSGRDIIIETEETFSLKCTDFILEASENIDIQSGVSTNLTSGVETAVDGGGEMTLQASMLTIN